MDSRVLELMKRGEKLFADAKTLHSFWQDVAENFCPQMADFTLNRNVGEDYAASLMTSYPILTHQELYSSIGAMARPADQPWFEITTSRRDRLDGESIRWLQWATNMQRDMMYDPIAKFVRATKETDRSYAAFGQGPMSIELSRDRTHLMFRAWHLRDVVWCEDENGNVSEVFRRWKPTLSQLARLFPGRLHASLSAELTNNPYKEIEVRHIVVSSEDYGDARQRRFPWISYYIDVTNEHVLEETPIRDHPYVIPRWETLPGTQYAHSPAIMAALPDARLIQAVTRTLYESGEKYVNPPMLAVREALRSDVDIQAGGITWVAAEYDERLGEVLRPITQDKSGFAIGKDMRDDLRDSLARAMYLNKFAMPPPEREMTAYEVGQRVSEYIRQAMPFFEPIESDYNAQVCERTFDIILHAGGFGLPETIPQRLRGQDIRFRFENPLRRAIESRKGQQLLEAGNLVAQASAFDPTAAQMIDASTALRDALRGIGTPEAWITTERDMDAIKASAAAKQQAAEMMGGLQQGSEIAANVAKALPAPLMGAAA
jgi:hypothetical protein